MRIYIFEKIKKSIFGFQIKKNHKTAVAVLKPWNFTSVDLFCLLFTLKLFTSGAFEYLPLFYYKL